MGIGFSTFLLAVGAILTFAVHATVAGLDIRVVGIVLMAAGALGLVLIAGASIAIAYWQVRGLA